MFWGQGLGARPEPANQGPVWLLAVGSSRHFIGLWEEEPDFPAVSRCISLICSNMGVDNMFGSRIGAQNALADLGGRPRRVPP